MSFDRERLLALLPAIYRRRDEEGDGTLGVLLGILAGQAEALGEDIAQLYDDQFIETCAEWVVPYIADLVGARGVVSIDEAGFSARAYVANTLRYRRRKGTIAVIEQLARDVTGWPASAVEYFVRLITTQNVNHIRLRNLATVDLRDWKAIERLNGAFETSAHTADVRRIAAASPFVPGRYNIPNIGIFLWRLQPYSLTESPAARVDDRRFLIHPLGIDAPLVTNPETETEIEHLAEPGNVPLPISRRVLDSELDAYYGPEAEASILIRKGNADVPLADVDVCDLSDDSHAWLVGPKKPVAIDPVLGRIALDAPTTDAVTTTTYYAFPADVGGGEYEREASFALGEKEVRKVPADFGTIAAALADLGGRTGVIEIGDSGRYEETLALSLGTQQGIEIRADNGRRPTLILGADLTVEGGEGARVYLNGLLIAGGVVVVPNNPNNKLALLQISHCTLVPGQLLARDGSQLHPDQPSIRVESPNPLLRVVLQRTIAGPLHISPKSTSVAASDTIIDAKERGSLAALVSGKLTAPIDLTVEADPTIDVTIGDRDPVAVKIVKDTYTVAQLRDALQEAIHKADPNALVLADSGYEYLIVIPGSTEPIDLQPHGGDSTLKIMQLRADQRRASRAAISDRIGEPVTFSAASPRVAFRIGEGSAFTETTVVGDTVVKLRNHLAAQIPLGGPGDEYKKAFVLSANRRLIVVPGLPDKEVVFGPAAFDRTTVRELGFAFEREAIRGDLAGGEAPPLSLARCTILGPVLAAELPLVTDTIFAAQVFARKKQTGCVRFSFVPEGSRTPRRYRCQPDLEVAEEIARRLRQGIPVTPADRVAIRAAIVRWLVPGFVTTKYGQPAYCQLTLTTPRQIRTGSEDGSEMGVYEMLKQPQREANLRAALEEYLRFGLEAGVFYAS